MARKVRGIVVVTAVSALVASAVWLYSVGVDERALPEGASEPEDPPASDRLEPSEHRLLREARIVSAGEKPLPRKDMPARDAVQELLPRARAGEAVAMRDLSLRLMKCDDVIWKSDEALQDRQVQRFKAKHQGHEPTTDDEVARVADRVEDELGVRDGCNPLPEDFDKRVEWLERAARAGDRDAMLFYAESGLEDMQDRDDVLTNLDEVVRRRKVAGEFLQQALSMGSCDALGYLAQAYHGGRNLYDWIYPPDPQLSAAYMEADFLWKNGPSPLADADPLSGGHDIGLHLQSGELFKARQQGQMIYQHYCANVPFE